MHNRQLFDRIVFSALAASLMLWLASNFFATVWYAKTPLVATDKQKGDAFGAVTAIEGDTIVVGAPYASFGNARSGTAYVFVRSGSGWVQQAKLVPTGNPLTWQGFGETLSISGDTIAVGVPGVKGKVYIFTRHGTTWSEQAKLTPPAQSKGSFASSVALDDDVLVVSDLGMAHVFLRDAATNSWAYQTTLTPNPVLEYEEGGSVAISNGVIVMRGSGRALVFGRASDGGTWQQQAELAIPAGRKAGVYTVAISDDTIIVGACSEHVGFDIASIGAVHVFERELDTGEWTYRTRLTPRGVRRGEAIDLTRFLSPYGFGSSIAIDGDVIVVGARTQSSLMPSQESAAYLFQRHPSRTGQWVQRAKLFVDNVEVSGNAVASVSVANKDVVLIGQFGAFVLNIDAPSALKQ
ncbi:MAG: hypothetical protein IGS49_24555 [Chlorogloeopsis fritschii C42_A2020_084]|jgi:hypothetical protein|uniref:FG-GAP repeat protein n=1 Tax=Chlorogloeopsis fritschii TaxID=1124 RepID=UPI0019D97BEC|nr:FG-GAP repeat protein [Chlorogloeopsis fritschii]MBF2008526.1 hypothetical protein [Chlorogloeopsis fritschii C42_A2020_084]